VTNDLLVLLNGRLELADAQHLFRRTQCSRAIEALRRG
jgi:hypothetical protein